MPLITRRSFLSTAARVGAAATVSKFIIVEAAAQQANARYAPVFSALDQYVERYMREMNAPGLTLSIADKDGVVRVATYGFSDVERKDRVRPEQLFQIGSITKSFAALILLQLVDEKKLDLHRAVIEYLPWLPFDQKWPITTHHLLTHTSGLPANAPIFTTDPSAKHQQGFEPGKAFHYSNLAFDSLGQLIEKLDGRPWSVAVRERILKPLSMYATEPVINNDIRPRTAKNYVPFRDDVPYPRYGVLAEAPNILAEFAAGSIASTPEDMARYMHAIINRRLISEESFKLFSTPHILAEEFGPKVHYGYGIAVDTLDGHKLLRHTGGMVSFMSAMQIDIESGIGAFASINAQQGYRPNPVAQYALKLMRAANENRPFPLPPEANDPIGIKNSAEYVGEYNASDGSKLIVRMLDGRLRANFEGQDVELQNFGADTFLPLSNKESCFLLTFSRANEKDPKAEVIEAGYGPKAYFAPHYTGPRVFPAMPAYEVLAGHYYTENPWMGSTRIVLRKGKLWVDGIIPLEQSATDRNLFHLRDEPTSPETIRFLHFVDGRPQMIKFSGVDLWRVMST
jgi:CubicO group peptidase (beta-lactamase class C family)